MKGQLSRVQDSNQQSVENQMSNLGVALALLEHDEMRVRQAIARHDGLLELLLPVLQDLNRITQSIRHTQDLLRQTWDSGQNRNWKP